MSPVEGKKSIRGRLPARRGSMHFDGTTGLRISLVALFRVLCFNVGTAAPIRESMTWTSKSYPDLTSKSGQCGEHIPRHTFLCDPDHLLTKEDAQNINRRLYELAVSTPCQCQRRSQCVTIGPNGNQLYVGFVTAVAMVRKIALSSNDPIDSQISTVAERFARAVRNRWALGDCDNSALILIWESQSILHISPDRITKLYVTEREIEQIQAHLGDLIRRRAYRKALELILDTLRMEYSGAPEEHVDTGTLSLIVSIAVAAILVIIITGCVCAFRCCGNLRPHLDQHSREALQSQQQHSQQQQQQQQQQQPTESLKRHLQARGFAFNQSPIMNRSPKPLQAVDGRFLPSARASPNFVTKFYPPMDHSIV
ncbi:Collagen alpha-2(XI) chain [Trichinella pseudospiralis]